MDIWLAGLVLLFQGANASGFELSQEQKRELQDCEYAQQPLVLGLTEVKANGATSNALCAGEVTCRSKVKKRVKFDVSCPSVSAKGCPPAKECVWNGTAIVFVKDT